MSKPRTRRSATVRATPAKRPKTPAFAPVPTRARHDGWTPDKQVRFVETLAESGCVREACAAVAMSSHSAYRLRMRVDAQGFRMAWDAALDLAIRRLSDECYARALHGEIVPHFYQGEQVGEHRRYDNRLAMFLLRYRDPLRYAATLDQMVYKGHPEAAALAFARARDRVADEARDMPIDPPDEDEEPDPAATDSATPYAATPIVEARHAQAEQAVIEGTGKIHGSHDRQYRLTQARIRHHEAQREVERVEHERREREEYARLMADDTLDWSKVRRRAAPPPGNAMGGDAASPSPPFARDAAPSPPSPGADPPDTRPSVRTP